MSEDWDPDKVIPRKLTDEERLRRAERFVWKPGDLRRVYPKNKKVLYIDMDNVLVDFQSGVDALNADLRAKYEGAPDEAPGIFALMRPMPGAVEAFNELADLFDTYILSTAPWNNLSAWSDKRLWVETWLGDKARKRLILSHHKNLNAGDYIIDDRTKHGVWQFQGEHLHFGTDARFMDWQSVLPYLRKHAWRK